MTIAIKGPDVSRRTVLAGLGGMSFCLAFGALTEVGRPPTCVTAPGG